MKKVCHKKFCLPPSSRGRNVSGLRWTSLHSALRVRHSPAATADAFCLSGGGRRAAAGFSLVEISLALLIVAVGMLAILGMFPAGLDQNTRSISDTHAALFAGEVFSSLRVHAETNWDGIGTTVTYLPVAGSNNWHKPVALDTMLDNKIWTNIYRHPANTNLIDHAFRYRITLTTNGQIKAVALRFWPGEFGTTNNPTMFYSEFYRMNR